MLGDTGFAFVAQLTSYEQKKKKKSGKSGQQRTK